jgi:hypothetical protein
LSNNATTTQSTNLKKNKVVESSFNSREYNSRLHKYSLLSSVNPKASVTVKPELEFRDSPGTKYDGNTVYAPSDERNTKTEADVQRSELIEDIQASR